MKNISPGVLDRSTYVPFTPSELAKDLLFYPTMCGHYFCTADYYIKREKYDPLLIMYVCKGLFHIEFRGKEYEAEKGDIILIDCTEPHYYHAHDGLEFLYLHFDGSNSHELCQHILTQTGPIIRQQSNALIEQLLYDMIHFYERNGIETMMQSSMRIYQILEYLISPPERQFQNDTPIEKVARYIQSHVGENITLEKMAGLANLSPYYFAHLFKEQTGFSPVEYVISTRLDHAKILLTNTNESIEEIAYKVGYASSASLIKVFTKREGIPPSSYRRLMTGPQN